ncbi:hypothetical protein ACN9MZ_27325 [Pseudoduganella sp. S-14]|uniref:hypothetical protein n=1 Tax=Pseudoduganella sp. S-14 TaxID=3404065 RepID=UPI003CF0A1EF
MHITQEQHECFISMGFTDRQDVGGYVSYWHPDTSILLICTSTLPLKNIQRIEECTDVVIAVENDFSAELAATVLNFATDVIRLKYIPQFMMYRAFSSECRDHLLAQSNFAWASAEYHEAACAIDYDKDDLDQAANARHAAVLALLTTPKPPAFRQTFIA